MYSNDFILSTYNLRLGEKKEITINKASTFIITCSCNP